MVNAGAVTRVTKLLNDRRAPPIFARQKCEASGGHARQLHPIPGFFRSIGEPVLTINFYAFPPGSGFPRSSRPLGKSHGTLAPFSDPPRVPSALVESARRWFVASEAGLSQIPPTTRSSATSFMLSIVSFAFPCCLEGTNPSQWLTVELRSEIHLIRSTDKRPLCDRRHRANEPWGIFLRS